MPTYRMPRAGDLLAVRTTSFDDPERHVVITRVADNGGVLVLAGEWLGRDLEVVVRRVGDTEPLT